MTIYDIKNENDYHTRMAAANGVLVVLGFFAKWCPPCNAIAPKLRQLAQELCDNVMVLKIEADFCPNLTKQFHITTVPTFFMMRDDKELEYLSGSNFQALKTCILKHESGTSIPDDENITAVVKKMESNAISSNEDVQFESKSVSSSDSLHKISGTPIPDIDNVSEEVDNPIIPIDDAKYEKEPQTLQPWPVTIVDQLEKNPDIVFIPRLEPAIYNVHNVSELHDLLVNAGNTLVILACITTWCRPCLNMTPVLDKLSEEYIGSLVIIKADMDKCKDIAQQFNITGFPTFVMMKGVNRELNRIVGDNQMNLRHCVVQYK